MLASFYIVVCAWSARFDSVSEKIAIVCGFPPLFFLVWWPVPGDWGRSSVGSVPAWVDFLRRLRPLPIAARTQRVALWYTTRKLCPSSSRWSTEQTPNRKADSHRPQPQATDSSLSETLSSGTVSIVTLPLLVSLCLLLSVSLSMLCWSLYVTVSMFIVSMLVSRSVFFTRLTRLNSLHVLSFFTFLLLTFLTSTPLPTQIYPSIFYSSSLIFISISTSISISIYW